MLGDGEGGEGGLSAKQGGSVGRRDDHDRARETLGPEIVLDELLHFAAALTDEADDRDIAVSPSGEHGEEHRLADARAREEAEALAFAKRREQVERSHRGGEAGADPGALGRRWRHRPERSVLGSERDRAAPVEGAAEAVDHPSQPRLARAKGRAGRDEFGRAAGDQAFDRVKGKGERALPVDGGDFRLDRSVATGQAQARADGRGPGKAPDFEKGALDAQQGAEAAARVGSPHPLRQRSKGRKRAQAASSVTRVRASCSSRIRARQSPSAR
jgi:hypothetical protein